MPIAAAAPRAPYALDPTTFSFPAIAAMAGRSALGGPRELALACFLLGRVVKDAALMQEPLNIEQLRHRAQGTKHWLGAAAIPAAIKASLSKLADATATGDASAMKFALDGVMTITANQLDAGARLELGRLAQAIAG